VSNNKEMISVIIDNPNNENKIILYSTADGNVRVDVFFGNEIFGLLKSYGKAF